MTKNRQKPILEVKIDEMSYPNKSIAYLDEGKKVEFKGGILGQTCRVKITRNRSTNKKAKYLELIKNSSIENNKDYCPNANICGGCAYQKTAYETELLLKINMIKNLLKENNIEIGNISITPSPKIKAYRNKMEYTFGDQEKGGPLYLGLHRKAKFYEIIDTKNCNIVDKDFEIIRQDIQNYFREKNASFYHKMTHKGLLRNLIVRKAHRTGQIMVILVTTSDESFDNIRKKLFVHKLLSSETQGKIVSIHHVINDSLADAVIVEKIELLFGKEYIEEEMSGLTFKISPFSFFQPNVFCAEKIYQKAIEFAQISKKDNVLDLYSGTGTISQLMAIKSNKAMGIEIVDEAVKMAKENALLNEIYNVDFIAGDVLEEIDKIKNTYNIITIDPPREGIHPKAINKIISFKPEKFIYISCNPKSQVRDLKIFLENGYKIKNYQIFDQFPRARHVEAIALLSKLNTEHHLDIEIGENKFRN